MKLEEAKKVLLIIRANIEFELQFIYADKTIAKLKEYIQAIDVSISELVALQNLLDEKREEIEHLQKENEELKDIDLTIVHLKGVADEKDRWRNKIREKIKEIYEDKNSEYYDMFLEQRDIEKTISILNDLLKEE
jgi:uncharacterized protein YhaN